jgi:hypothetical protein
MQIPTQILNHASNGEENSVCQEYQRKNGSAKEHSADVVDGQVTSSCVPSNVLESMNSDPVAKHGFLETASKSVK